MWRILLLIAALAVLAALLLVPDDDLIPGAHQLPASQPPVAPASSPSAPPP